MVANCKLGSHPGLPARSQDFDDAPHGRCAPAGERREFNRNQKAWLCTPSIFGWHHDIFGKPRICGPDKADTVLAEISARKSLTAALKDVYQAPLRTPVSTLLHAHCHAVAVKQGAHRPRREKHVFGTVIGRKKPESIAMREYRAGFHRQSAGQAELATPVLYQIAVTSHCPEAMDQGFVLLIFQPKISRDQFHRQRHLASAEVLAQQPPAGDRLRVAFGFSRAFRIELSPLQPVATAVGYFASRFVLR